MKKLYFLFLLTLPCFTALSQTAASYSMTRSAGTYTSIAGQPGTVAITDPTCAGLNMTSDDYATTNIPLNFTFKFCGTNYTVVAGNSNGVLALNNTTTPDGTVTTSYIQPGWICPLWQDLWGVCSTAYYQTSGAVGSRVFTIEWSNWQLFSTQSGCNMNFQVKLFEGTNAIQFCYGSFLTGPPNNAVIGIANSGSDYSTLTSTTSSTANSSLNATCTQPANGTILQWCPPAAAITGAAPMCPGATITLSTTSTGGVWTSSNTSIATVGSATGIVTGVAAGSATISYTPQCGAVATTAVSVSPLPAVPGSNTPVCVGSTITLTDASGAGRWVSGNTTVAAIGSSTGVVTPASAGTTPITFTLTSTGCSNTTVVTVNPLPASITGPNTVCPGSSFTLNNLTAGGNWTSSNTSVATVGSTSGIVSGATSGTANITYTVVTTGCRTSYPVTVYSLPAATTGATPVCPGATMILSNPTLGGGTWISGSPGVATINSSTGVVTGISGGTATITFTATNTGCIATSTVSINAAPAPIGGVLSACEGGTTTLTDATPGGTWNSSNSTQAAIGGGTGVVSATVAGNPTITYTVLSSGCWVTAVYTVNPLPATIGGPNSVCAGSSASLSDGSAGGTWTVSGTGVATIGSATGVVNGLVNGTTFITYTLPTGCTTGMPFFVNALPTAYNVTGGGSYCLGAAGVHIGLSYGSTGVNYQLFNGATPVTMQAGANAGLDFGMQTATGTYTVTAVNVATGCAGPMSGSATVGTLTQPDASITVTGGGSFCAGGTGVAVGISSSEGGVSYQLYQGAAPLGAPLPGTGTSLSFGIFTSAGNYTVTGTNASGCSSTLTGSAAVSVKALPAAYTVSGGGHFCAGGAGLTISLSSSDLGSSYQVYRGSTPVGSPALSPGGPLTFGPFTTAGVYTIQAIDALTGCTNNMSGSATIVVDPAPAMYSVTGGGSYCFGASGLHIGLSYSTVGINYQLKSGSTVIATLAGSGSGLDFGIQGAPGTYTVTGVNPASGCTQDMAGGASINVNPLPVAYTITGGGPYCFGTPGPSIGLGSSESLVNYQLYRGTTPVGPLVAGTGGSLSFGAYTASGTYSVVATSAVNGCTMPQLGTAAVSVNPLPPLHAITGGGGYCAGAAGSEILLNGSDANVSYELYLNGAAQSILQPGTGAPLDFGPQAATGVYTIVATDMYNGCIRTMSGSTTVSIYSIPTSFNVSGGGSFCSGSTGVHITLSGTSAGVSYRLQNGGPIGLSMSGSGGPLDFGPQTVAGTYTVIATNIITGCTNTMSGSANVTVNPLPVSYAVSGGGSYCAGGSGVGVITIGSDAGVSYQLYRGLTPLVSLAGAGSVVDFGNQTVAGTYTVVATDDVTHCRKNMPGSAVINVIAPAVYNVTGGGAYCDGGLGVHVGEGGSATGVSYQLLKNGSAFGTPMSGTGSSLDFGLQTDGVYRIVATDVASTCSDTMAGSASVILNVLPDTFNVTGGGSFCTGGTSTPIGLGGSASGINYQLFRGTTAVGAAMPGNGLSLDFGPQTVGGIYTIVGTNPATHCSVSMTGTAVLTASPLPAPYPASVTGANPAYPGYYCAADSGVHIYLPSSDAGVKYQLWRGAVSVGSVVNGTGSMLDLGLQNIAGTYTVTGVDTGSSGCANNMLGSAVVHIINLPDVHNVTGGGSFCRGGAGVDIALDGSQPGYYYELFDGTVSQGLMYGTGGALDFGLQTATGNYTIVGNNQITTCLNNMFGSATVTYETIPTPVASISAYPGNGIGVWHVDSIMVNVSTTGAAMTYQWYINGNIIPGATNASFTNHVFYNRDSVACVITAHTACGTNSSRKSMVITLDVEGVASISGTAGYLNIIPNPNSGVFTLKGNIGEISNGQGAIQITNVLGQSVYEAPITIRNGAIEEYVTPGTLSKGVYILNIRCENKNMAQRFVVQ